MQSSRGNGVSPHPSRPSDGGAGKRGFPAPFQAVRRRRGETGFPRTLPGRPMEARGNGVSPHPSRPSDGGAGERGFPAPFQAVRWRRGETGFPRTLPGRPTEARGNGVSHAPPDSPGAPDAPASNDGDRSARSDHRPKGRHHAYARTESNREAHPHSRIGTGGGALRRGIKKAPASARACGEPERNDARGVTIQRQADQTPARPQAAWRCTSRCAARVCAVVGRRPYNLTKARPAPSESKGRQQ